MFTRLFRVVLIATTIFLAAMVSLWQTQQISQAQSGDIVMTKVLDRPTNVVRVGEVLTFTITLTNESAFTLTSVTVVDNYDNTSLAFAGAIPPIDQHDPGAAVLTWTNVAVPPIPPGQTISLTVVFTAEHPKPAVVNFARAQDIIHSSGALSYTAETSQTQDAIGGSAPVFKTSWPTGTIPITGLPITFTHLITNDGAALMTFLPLTDTYDAVALQFNYAIPTPTIISPPGLLVWSNLASTTYFGPISPFQTIVVTTVFTAVTNVISAVNEASTEGAQDEYDNDMTGGQAQVPIIILPAPTDTPPPEPTPADTATPVPTNTPKPRQEEQPAPAPTATATPIPFPTATATATSVPFPTVLPETGRSNAVSLALLLVGVGLLAAGWAFLARK
jgi:hypothetical protein